MAGAFDIRRYTSAALRMDSRISYRGKTAAEVFDILGDPQRITDWHLLAKGVKLHPRAPGEAQAFHVELTFFGDLFEEILHWDPPRRYVYQARGPDFPIKDYVACIELREEGERAGVLRWAIHCDCIEGEEYRRILPVLLPAVNEASMKKLSELIGGTAWEVRSFF